MIGKIVQKNECELFTVKTRLINLIIFVEACFFLPINDPEGIHDGPSCDPQYCKDKKYKIT